ncbi:hypothetical protein ACQUFY_16840 [Robbsia andropogonis]|uniref:hypothetical protein n=1 Tax=Robbsia andropogonis TaxID=28092 RepID=UPI003D1B1F4C
MTFHSDYQKVGFKADEIYWFLTQNGITLLPWREKPEPPAVSSPALPEIASWKLAMRAMPCFTVNEAAHILADCDPFEPDYGEYNIDPEAYAERQRNKRILFAAIDANDLPGGQWADDRNQQEIPHAALRAWCDENGIVWPIPTLTPRPASNEEALAEIERLRAEIVRLTGELREAREGESMGDHPLKAIELDIANIAWRAAINGWHEGRKETPKDFISNWLAKNYSELTVDQRDRIATVANWRKMGGRPRKVR